jgi:hypothetical protein
LCLSNEISFFFSQEWEEKAKAAKEEFNVAMEEYLKNKPEAGSNEEEEEKYISKIWGRGGGLWCLMPLSTIF